MSIRVGVIGYGYWGPNLVRNFSESKECEVVWVSDLRPERLALAHRRVPKVNTSTNCLELIESPEVDAVVISTPVSTHFDLAMRALQEGKHVLIEKPLARTSEEALRLIDTAEKRGLVLMVDHTFVYTGAVRKIHELTAAGELGDLYYYDSVRINLGLFQSDADVIYDLAVHDFAIMDYLLPSGPIAISATGSGHIPGASGNIAYITAFFENSLIGHVHVNWLSPVKVRQTLIGGSRRMVLYDDVDPSEKVKVYDRGINYNAKEQDPYEFLVSYRLGDLWAPKLDTTEALTVEVAHFADCIKNRREPITDGHAGYRVVRILEAAVASKSDRGRPVVLESRSVLA